MEPMQRWTGRTACALQAALRMTNESFAAHLGTAVRTVATWHQKPDRVPSAEIQQALDTTLERAGEGTQARFIRNAAETDAKPEPPSPPCEGSARTAEDETATAVDDRIAPASPTIMMETAEDTADGSFMGWLQVAHAASAPPDGSDVGQIIRWYRMHEELTQQDVAARLNTTQSRLSKLEKGTQALRDVTELRHIARKLGMAPSTCWDCLEARERGWIGRADLRCGRLGGCGRARDLVPGGEPAGHFAAVLLAPRPGGVPPRRVPGWEKTGAAVGGPAGGVPRMPRLVPCWPPARHK